MKLDKDTYLLAQDLFIRHATAPTFKGNNLPQLATDCIRQANAFMDQWDAMQKQVAAAATQAVENARPVIQPLPRKGDAERQTLSKAPAKPLRAKASAKREKTPAKPLRKKAKKGRR
jgi:hypothetical protein